MVFAAGESGVTAEHFDTETAKFQLAHFRAGALVVLAVTVERRLPAAGDAAAGEKRQVFGFPIARHKAFEVVAVPGVLLAIEKSADVGFWVR